MLQPGVERRETPGKRGYTNNSHAEGVQQKRKIKIEPDSPNTWSLTTSYKL